MNITERFLYRSFLSSDRQHAVVRIAERATTIRHKYSILTLVHNYNIGVELNPPLKCINSDDHHIAISEKLLFSKQLH